MSNQASDAGQNNHSGTALLVMDVQSGIVKNIKEPDQLINNLKTAIAAAHKANITVIYVVVAFRPGYPEVSQNNKSFSQIKQRKALFVSPDAMAIYPEIAPAPEGIIVTKRRVSAFSGSDLEIILRAQRINHLVLSGISTSGVVLSTLREAADKDYALTVLSDGCADSDEETHRVLLSKVFPRQAEVTTVKAWSSHL